MLDVKDRLCKVCNTGTVEDEDIFSLTAVLIIHYSIVLWRWCRSHVNTFQIPQDAQLIWLMINESDDIINLFSRYI